MGIKDLGVCYLAEQPEGCFLEVFKSFSVVVPQPELDVRRLARIELPKDITLADCTAEGARSWGITAEIHSGPNYSQTWGWADAFARTGFHGIRYLLRHDPAQRMAGVALFGPAGPALGYPTDPGELIGPDLLQEVRRRFGIRVVRKL